MEVLMAGGTSDKAKGRAKEATGALKGDRKLKSEGKVDQAVGKVKDTIDRLSDKAKRAIRGKPLRSKPLTPPLIDRWPWPRRCGAA
jgi:uncharacterized protein YjbJ (UPF0337 family)